jgi:hypothetical protein
MGPPQAGHFAVRPRSDSGARNERPHAQVTATPAALAGAADAGAGAGGLGFAPAVAETMGWAPAGTFSDCPQAGQGTVLPSKRSGA